MQCLPPWGWCAVELLPCSASLPLGSGPYNLCNALPHSLGAVGSGTPAMHRLTAWGQWALQLLQCAASLPKGSGQCSRCNALPQCLGGQWAVQLLQSSPPPPPAHRALCRALARASPALSAPLPPAAARVRPLCLHTPCHHPPVPQCPAPCLKSGSQQRGGPHTGASAMRQDRNGYVGCVSG